jgi:hypothetical protein
MRREKEKGTNMDQTEITLSENIAKQPSRWFAAYSCYGLDKHPKRVRFSIEDELVQAFGVEPCRIEAIDIEHWVVTKDIYGRALPRRYKGQKYWTLEMGAPADARGCHQSNGDATIVDGKLLIYCPLATRRWYDHEKGRIKRKRPVPPLPPEHELPIMVPALTAAIAIARADDVVARGQECLRQIRDMEATTIYRLGKTKDGAWTFSVPRII